MAKIPLEAPAIKGYMENTPFLDALNKLIANVPIIINELTFDATNNELVLPYDDSNGIRQTKRIDLSSLIQDNSITINDLVFNETNNELVLSYTDSDGMAQEKTVDLSSLIQDNSITINDLVFNETNNELVLSYTDSDGMAQEKTVDLSSLNQGGIGGGNLTQQQVILVVNRLPQTHINEQKYYVKADYLEGRNDESITVPANESIPILSGFSANAANLFVKLGSDSDGVWLQMHSAADKTDFLDASGSLIRYLFTKVHIGEHTFLPGPYSSQTYQEGVATDQTFIVLWNLAEAGQTPTPVTVAQMNAILAEVGAGNSLGLNFEKANGTFIYSSNIKIKKGYYRSTQTAYIFEGDLLLPVDTLPDEGTLGQGVWLKAKTGSRAAAQNLNLTFQATGAGVDLHYKMVLNSPVQGRVNVGSVSPDPGIALEVTWFPSNYSNLTWRNQLHVVLYDDSPLASSVNKIIVNQTTYTQVSNNALLGGGRYITTTIPNLVVSSPVSFNLLALENGVSVHLFTSEDDLRHPGGYRWLSDTLGWVLLIPIPPKNAGNYTLKATRSANGKLRVFWS